jgi:hypothetical protein
VRHLTSRVEREIGFDHLAIDLETKMSLRWTHKAMLVGTAALVAGTSYYAASRGSSTPSSPQQRYEVDHLISLELGGSNSIKNLWPEPGFPNPKDKLENRLHAMVCNGQLSLLQAQHDIATNWVHYYQQYMGSAPNPPAHYDPHNVWSLPTGSLTPGDIDRSVTKKVVCTTSTSTRRSVSQSTKDKVYAEYGVHR